MSMVNLSIAEEDALVNLLVAYLASETAQDDLPLLRSVLHKLDPDVEVAPAAVVDPAGRTGGTA